MMDSSNVRSQTNLAHVPPGWELGGRLTTHPRKNVPLRNHGGRGWVKYTHRVVAPVKRNKI
jgi:hypothetical protein